MSFPYSTVPLPDEIVIGGTWPHTIISWPGGKSRGATKPEHDLFQALEAAYEELTTLRADKAELLEGCKRGLAYALAAALDHKPHFTQERGECANYDAACDLADHFRALIAKHTKP